MDNCQKMLVIWDHLKKTGETELALLAEHLFCELQEMMTSSDEDEDLSEDEGNAVQEIIRVREKDGFLSLK
jgi:hypothetical protein